MMHEELKCKNCKYYEPFHKYLNPNSTPSHYCTKCNERIEYTRYSNFCSGYVIKLPKDCYFNDYFEESEESKRKRSNMYITHPLGVQVE